MLQRLQENKSFEGRSAAGPWPMTSSKSTISRSPIPSRAEIYGYEALVRWFHPVRGASAADGVYSGGRENRSY
ncbi:hypothetical protein LN650_11070 [Klebsiella pneumoniae subsp. pneumoniae]|nr:hypothetical protein [Klebsiella pneumoniae subsp. pneumoniae]